MSDIKDNSIHTLNIYSRNDKNAFPIIRLNSKEKIHLNFDYFVADKGYDSEIHSPVESFAHPLYQLNA